MKKLLNTLYITQEGVYLSLEGENIVALKDNAELARVPFCNLEGIICFNYTGCSPALMGKCAENGINLCFLKPSGRFLARVTGPIKGNVLLRQAQFDAVRDKDVCLAIARNTVAAKLHNSRYILYRYVRDHADNCNIEKIESVIDLLGQNIESVFNSQNIENIMGIEGESARMYFSVFGFMVHNSNFFFNGRSKRPPLDNVNAVLSFLYSLLAADVQWALETVGLDPYVGYMHVDRPGRPALALDLMEELRAFFVDKTVLNIINLKQIKGEDFLQKEGGGIVMGDECRRQILKLWQERKREVILHDGIKEKIQIGLIPYVQSQIFARFLRKDIPEYKPFLVK